MAPHSSVLTDREHGAIANCEMLFERLKRVVQEETAALERQGATRHAQFFERKNQILRDLLTAQRNQSSPHVGMALAPRARELQTLLKRNQTLLRAHIDAMRDVSAIIVDAIRQSESDGTYSRPLRG